MAGLSKVSSTAGGSVAWYIPDDDIGGDNPEKEDTKEDT